MGVLHITMCDDDMDFIKQLHDTVQNWFAQNWPEQAIEINTFSSGTELLDSPVTPGEVFFFDIEMPEISGLEVAKQIRERIPNSIIIFLTAHEEYAMDGYRVSAIRYLCKTELNRYLPESLEAVMREYSKIKHGNLPLQRYGSVSVLPYEEIIYIQHVLRYSQIHTASYGIIKDKRGLKDIHSLLDEEQFVFIERGTFVNMDYIFQIQGNELVLRNKEQLPISRGMLPKLKAAINKKWGMI